MKGRIAKNPELDHRNPNSIRFPSRFATLAIVFRVIEVFSGSSSRSTPDRLVFSRLATSAGRLAGGYGNLDSL
jgi:hypothetical protein